MSALPIGASNHPSTIAPVGSWFNIPAENVTLNKSLLGARESYSIVGANGNTYTIPQGLVKVDTSLWDEARALGTLGTFYHFTYTSGSVVTVRFSSETYDLLLGLGLIRSGTPRPIGGQNQGNTDFDWNRLVVVVGVVAVLGAAIYFVPKDILSRKVVPA